MIVESVSLENIRSYKSQEIRFNSGINFLSGDIGSGKSTILLAIEFALFGFKRGDLEAYHILRKGELEGSVKLKFKDEETNEVLEIFRKLKKSKSSDAISQENGYINYAGNLIELSPQEINSKVFEIMNFPKEFQNKNKNLIYRFTTYTPQEQLKEILFSEKDEKLEIIRKLFGIDKYKKLQTAISIYLNEKRTDKKVLESKLENKEEVGKRIIELKLDIANSNEKLDELRKKENAIKLNFEKCDEALKKRDEVLDKIRNKKTQVEKEITVIDENKKQIDSLIKKLKDSETIGNNKEDIENKIKERKKEISENKEKITKIEKTKIEVEKNKSQIEKFEKIKKELETKYNELDSKTQILNSKSKNFDYILTKCKLKDTQVEISKLEKKNNRSDKLKLKIEEKSKEIVELQVEIKNLKKEFVHKREHSKDITKLENCETCMQKIDASHKDKLIIEIKKELGQIEIEINNKLERIDEYEKEQEKNKEKLEEIELDSDKLIELKEKEKNLILKEKEEKIIYEEINQLKKEINELNNEKIDDKLKEINSKINNEEVSKKIDEINNKKIEISEKQNKMEIELHNLLTKLNEIEKNTKEQNQIKNEIDKLRKNVSSVDELNKEKKKIDDREKEINESRKKYTNYKESLHEKEKLLSTTMSSIKTNLENYKKEFEEKEKLLKEIDKYGKRLTDLIYFEKFLGTVGIKITDLIERSIFTKFYSQFNEEFERLFKELIEDNEIDVRLDEVFSIIVEQNGYDIDIKNLSGGEKASLAVAYRLGLKKIIENSLGSDNKLNILILDEPTDGFSNEQIDRLGNILKESELRQILLVSHDEKIESISDTIIKIEKVNHVSSIS